MMFFVVTQVLTAMGLKTGAEDDSDASGTSDNEVEYDRDRELDDEDSYPRSRTPVLDDVPNFRGHTGIGPTPTGGLLGDFPRGELLTNSCFELHDYVLNYCTFSKYILSFFYHSSWVTVYRIKI